MSGSALPIRHMEDDFAGVNARSAKDDQHCLFMIHISLDTSVNADIWKIMRDFTSLGQAIVDPTRVRIIAALRRGELCVCELVDALEISQSTLSGHLQVLRQTGLVITRKDGRWIYYSLTDRKTALIDALFSHIQPAGDGDPRLRRDSRRIERRLAIRENGRCVLGFTELEKHQAALK
jgi:ArsR family transcriptional regulator